MRNSRPSRSLALEEQLWPVNLSLLFLAGVVWSQIHVSSVLDHQPAQIRWAVAMGLLIVALVFRMGLVPPSVSEKTGTHPPLTSIRL